jgi:sugar phosphate isomerase/epimerase
VGLTRIELCGAHVNFGDTDAHGEVIRTYADAGVTIASIGVETMGDDEAENRKRFEFARAAGCDHISINFSPEAFDAAHPIVQRLAEEYGLRCGIHNHGGYHWLGSTQALHYVFSKVGDRIGLCLDTAWALNARQDPVKMVETFGHRLFAVHFKDFVFHHPDGRHEDVVVGTGNLDLPALLAAMEDVGFDGEAISEYEGDVDNPVPSVKQCVQAIRAAG